VKTRECRWCEEAVLPRLRYYGRDRILQGTLVLSASSGARTAEEEQKFLRDRQVIRDDSPLYAAGHHWTPATTEAIASDTSVGMREQNASTGR
jgi:hypothetical protein